MSTNRKYDVSLLEPDTMTDNTIVTMVRSGKMRLMGTGRKQLETDMTGDRHSAQHNAQYSEQSMGHTSHSSRPTSNHGGPATGNISYTESPTIEVTDYSFRPRHTDGALQTRTYKIQTAYPNIQNELNVYEQISPSAKPDLLGPSWRSIFAIWACILLLGLGWGLFNFDKFRSHIVAPLEGVSTRAVTSDSPENEVVESVEEELVAPLIIAEAFVRPYRQADLGPATTGLVKNLYIQEGDIVTAGQLILELDNSQQTVAIAQAKANLARTEARLAEVRAGSRSEELLAQQAIVEAAQARLASLLNRNIVADEQAAMAKIQGAEARLASLLNRNIVADEQAAMAKIQAAEAKLTSLLNRDIAADEQAATAKIRAAEAELSNLYQVPETAEVIAARAALKNAEAVLPESQDLQQATNDYEAAQARLNLLYADPNGAQVSDAQARIAQAQAELEQVRKPADPGDVEAARAEISQAQAERLLQAGTRTEVIKFAEAEVGAAQAELLNAEVALSQTELRAPFDGAVVTIDAEVGEYLQPGQFVARIGDLSQWQLVTDDLIELDVINVVDGASAQIYVDSMPELELTGKVTRIQRFGENKVGDITYTVFIEPDRYVPELAWNMTASVHIVHDDSLQN